jgi:hypothetical protein
MPFQKAVSIWKLIPKAEPLYQRQTILTYVNGSVMSSRDYSIFGYVWDACARPFWERALFSLGR